MELNHEGHRFKLIVVTGIADLASTEEFSNCDRYILDCRTIQPEHILTELASLCQFIQQSKVSHVWINCGHGRFLEIKERLAKMLKENDEKSQDTHHAILKLTTHDQSVPASDALKTSIDVLNFGNNVLDIHRFLDAHPGLLNRKAHLNNALKRKRQNDNEISVESAVALPATAYSDNRRPRKKVFKALKRMTNESNESQRRCYMCSSTACFDHLCDDCRSLNSDMKKVTCDLKGRYAVVTGGRIKIGFETERWLFRHRDNSISSQCSGTL